MTLHVRAGSLPSSPLLSSIAWLRARPSSVVASLPRTSPGIARRCGSPGTQQRRSYLLLQTTLHPKPALPALPPNLPAPPRTILLLTTPHSAASLNPESLAHLTNDRSTTLLAAAVDSLPGASGERVRGHSLLFTDHVLPIKPPRLLSSPLPRHLTFSLPTSSLTLPLANTVFQTGATSAFVHLPASKTPVEIQASPELSKTEVEEFANAKEDIREVWEELGELMELVGQRSGLAPATVIPETSAEIKFSAEVVQPGRIYTQLPLKALTPPRKVKAGMGNILRALEVEGGAEGQAGASRELEKAVEKYTDGLDAGDPREKINVFARLTVTRPEEGSAMDLLIAPGARLHRVLSGGGGWGSKAGLLSLDPQGETEIDTFAREFEAKYGGGTEAPGSEPDPQRDDSQVEGEAAEGNVNGNGDESGMIVKEGEWVQFFVAEKPQIVEERGIRFGCVRKVEDVEEKEADEGKEEVRLEGVFGGFAESGGVDVAIAGRTRRMDVPGGAVVIEV